MHTVPYQSNLDNLAEAIVCAAVREFNGETWKRWTWLNLLSDIREYACNHYTFKIWYNVYQEVVYIHSYKSGVEYDLPFVLVKFTPCGVEVQLNGEY